MERKVGEIFEYNGEWYQCMHVPQKHSCKLCDLRGLCCDNNGVKIVTCAWRHRKDNTSVIFKKLEKVGEPTMLDGKLVQKILKTDRYSCNGCCFESLECDKADNDLCCEYEIYVEIKQNKEDMEEREYSEEDMKNNPRFKHHKNIEQVINMQKMKPFDLEAAKAGKPVCTRDGRKARIICFDLNNKNFPIVAIINCDTEENAYQYDIDGVCDEHDNNLNLMVLHQKKEGWINIYTCYDGAETGISIYKTKEIAKKEADNDSSYLDTIKIEWEE